MDYHLIAFRMKKRHEAEDKQRFVNAVLGSDFKPWSFEEKSLRRHMFLTMPEKNYPSEEDFLNAVHGTVLIANDIIDQKRTENPIYWTDERTSLHKEEAAQKILTHMVAGLLDMYYGKRNANIYDIKTFLSLSRPTDRSLGSCLSLNGLANFVKIVSDAKEGEIGVDNAAS